MQLALSAVCYGDLILSQIRRAWQVCLRYARKLLDDPQMKGISSGRFMEEWQQLVPQVSFQALSAVPCAIVMVAHPYFPLQAVMLLQAVWMPVITEPPEWQDCPQRAVFLSVLVMERRCRRVPGWVCRVLCPLLGMAHHAESQLKSDIFTLGYCLNCFKASLQTW